MHDKTKIIHNINGNTVEWFEDWNADEGKAPLERLDLVMFENMLPCIVVRKEPGVLHVATHPKAKEMHEVLFSPEHNYVAGMLAAYIIHAKWLAKRLCERVPEGELPVESVIPGGEIVSKTETTDVTAKDWNRCPSCEEFADLPGGEVNQPGEHFACSNCDTELAADYVVDKDGRGEWILLTAEQYDADPIVPGGEG